MIEKEEDSKIFKNKKRNLIILIIILLQFLKYLIISYKIIKLVVI